jgi:hypothetical protein
VVGADLWGAVLTMDESGYLRSDCIQLNTSLEYIDPLLAEMAGFSFRVPVG